MQLAQLPPKHEESVGTTQHDEHTSVRHVSVYGDVFLRSPAAVPVLSSISLSL